MSGATPTVLSIAGTGQNGATLLSRMLGELPGFVAVGELGFLWDRALVGDQSCGCGERFRECDFWARVGELAWGGWDRVDARSLAALRDRILLRRRHLSLPLALPYILRPSFSPGYEASVLRYAETMSRLYDAIRRASGASVIVDSTKVPAHVYMLRSVRGFDVRAVHLIRDSRGVAHSNQKVVVRQSSVDGKTHRGRHAPHRTAVRWMWINLAFELLPRFGVPTLRVRYESMVRAPKRELARIAHFTGRPVDEDALSFVHDDQVDLPPAHLVAGNRMRLARGLIPLRTDEAWRTQLDPVDRRLVGAITWPLMRRYSLRG